MWQSNRRLPLALLIIGIMVLTALPETNTVAAQHGDSLHSLRGMLHAQSSQNPLLFSGNRPTPPTQAATLDSLLHDFSAAAALIHAQTLTRQQHLAANAGHYDQAMRLMAKSFVSSVGTGSYAALN
ncbi:hypothetical protein [Ferrimonas senticii]|uniref:hypothetical protein n=1 Tax=Ferrimonas senticii TaxID=394566 RepID=UPI00041C8D89|nr:hypothetical protein [Ferrimonas senticii]